MVDALMFALIPQKVENRSEGKENSNRTNSRLHHLKYLCESLGFST